MKIIPNGLIIYASTQTYTATVFEHLQAFRQYSKIKWFYSDFNDFNKIDISNFDIVLIHYCVRFPLDQINNNIIKTLAQYKGVKIAFLQDEYEGTNITIKKIRSAFFNLIFTSVPEKKIHKIYNKKDFKNTKFINTLTGYIPSNNSQFKNPLPIEERKYEIVYRGRNLPLKYGYLGFQKKDIGVIFKQFCQKNNIRHDIETDDRYRIYGDKWFTFLQSSKATLGSESGCNIFDWNSNLNQKIDKIKKKYPDKSENEIYEKYLKKYEINGLMEQISPKVFESILSKTLLIMIEGNYSGILKKNIHYIPIKKDFSNIENIAEFIKDDKKITKIVNQAYKDIVRSGKYTFKAFIVDFDKHALSITKQKLNKTINTNNFIKTYPIKNNFPLRNNKILLKLIYLLWDILPLFLKNLIRFNLSISMKSKKI
jgi:hypothetical protein